tara:strand:- start:598 stop:1173 length:576 start_codon:yes stop_codon:yes gene_type:complete
MWASVDTDNNVTKVYNKPTAITYGDVNYPKNVMSSWSNSELATIKVYPVVEDKNNYEDENYYINTNETFTYHDSVSVGGTTYTNTVVGTYGTATPKSLDDLKSNAVTVQKQQAYSLLQPSDWYVVRKSENGVAIPTDWDNWRESIRTTCQSQITMINACTTVPELQALYVYSGDPATRPLPEFSPSPDQTS